MDEIFKDRRKQGCDKSTSYKIKSLKRLRPQCHQPSNSQLHNLLSPIKMRPMIQPLSVSGLSAASYAQLTINPQLLAHLSASTGQCHPAGAGDTEKDGHSGTLETELELSETRNQEELHRLRQEDVKEEGASGVHKEPGQRTVRLQEEPHLRNEEGEETDGLHDIEKVVVGRKASKKHKSKWGRKMLH